MCATVYRWTDNFPCQEQKCAQVLPSSKNIFISAKLNRGMLLYYCHRCTKKLINLVLIDETLYVCLFSVIRILDGNHREGTLLSKSAWCESGYRLDTFIYILKIIIHLRYADYLRQNNDKLVLCL